jgi:drug/metabolite transporter (DMT)-like permease
LSVRLTGSVLALGAALLWGTSWVATGLALRDFTPAAVAAWRGVGSVVVMGVLIGAGGLYGRRRSAGPRLPATDRLLRYLVLALFGGPWFVLGMTLAVQLTGATISAFVAGLYPVVAAAAAPLLLPERPSWLAVGGLVVAFGGVIVLGGFDPVGLPVEGFLVALLAAVVFALYLLLARRWSVAWDLSPMAITSSNLGLLALTALPLALVLDGPAALSPPAAADGWLAVAWLIVAATVMANLLIVASVRRLPAHESSAYLMLAPLAAALLAGPLLGERLTVVQAVGAGLVLAGIAAATVPLRRLLAGRRRQPATDIE